VKEIPNIILQRLRSGPSSRDRTLSHSPKRARTPVKEVPKDPDVAYKSGSEEGEIEEE
jgi:hypothetical protein